MHEDADVFYDLKQMLTKSPLSKVPEELKRHEAAQKPPQARESTVGKKTALDDIAK